MGRSRDAGIATRGAGTEPGDPAARDRSAAPALPEPAVAAPLPELARLSPSTPTPAVERADPEAAAQASIGAVLDSYRQALNRLDAASAASVWRGADTAGLARAFASLISQDVRFDKCDIALDGGQATATCRGAVNYVPRVGSRSERLRPLTWTIRLVEADDRWLIDSVTTR